MARCTAKNRNGERCKRQAAVGFKVCASHGGNEKSGAPIKHGRYSQKLIPRLKNRMEEFLANPDLKRLDHEIALNLVLIEECLGDESMEAAFESIEEPITALKLALLTKDATLATVGPFIAAVLDAHREGAAAWARMEVYLKHVKVRMDLLKTDAFQTRVAKEGLSVSEQAAFLLMVQESLMKALREHDVANPAVILSTTARNLNTAFGSRPLDSVARPERH